MTLWVGFAILVEIAAERPARPAPMIIRWIDIWVVLFWREGNEMKTFRRGLLSGGCLGVR
jgi:hypothetical protein